jgi:hypothetical protein
MVAYEDTDAKLMYMLLEEYTVAAMTPPEPETASPFHHVEDA